MSREKRPIKLLSQNALIKTSPIDHADWNFRPVLGWIQRRRFHMVVSLLPSGQVHRLLEIGYGSGVFLPELSLHCSHLYGLDVHSSNREVMDRLREINVFASLVSGSAESMPFDTGFFDCAVAVSSLEFVQNVNVACEQISRVLKPGGLLIVLTPGYSALVDCGLQILTGQNPKENYSDRRKNLLPALQRWFSIVRRRTFPQFGGHILTLYNALCLCRK